MKSQSNKERSLQEKSVRGIKWQIGTEVLARAIQLVTMFVLARLLLPADFGLIGMALIFTQLAYVLFDMGLSVPLIQKKDLEPRHYQTAFSVFLVLAFVFYTAVFFVAPFVAAFFNKEVLVSILRWLSIIFLFYALRGVATVRLTKQLRFRALGTLQLISVLVYSFVAIFLALKGAGVWSFVLALIGQELILTLTNLLVLKEWYLPLFSRTTLKELTGFGGLVFVTRIVGYLNVNLPNIVIGRWLGETALGYYSVGYQLVDFPVQRISKNILRVMFPTLSKLQDNPKEFNYFYQETLRGMLLVILPIFTGMVLVAPEFVQMVYGEKWQPLIPILKILTLVGFARSLWTLTSVIFLAKGKPKTELIINVFYFVSLFSALIFLHSKGLIAIVSTVAVLILGWMLAFLIASLNLMHFSLKHWFKAVRVPLVSSILMALIVLGGKSWFLAEYGAFLRLLVMVGLGAVVYTALALSLDKSLLTYVKKIFQAR